MPNHYKQMDKVLAKLGWTCTDEIYRYPSGRPVGLKKLLTVMPKGTSIDDLCTHAEDCMWAEVRRYNKTPEGRKETRQALANIRKWNAKVAAEAKKKGKSNRNNRAKG